MTKRCRVRIDEPNQYFGYNPAAHGAKPIAIGTCFGFAKNVIPERSFAMPVGGCEADLLRSEWCGSDVTRNCFAGWHADSLPSLQVAKGERMMVFIAALTSDRRWQGH